MKLRFYFEAQGLIGQCTKVEIGHVALLYEWIEIFKKVQARSPHNMRLLFQKDVQRMLDGLVRRQLSYRNMM